jgi:hypothetical protein
MIKPKNPQAFPNTNAGYGESKRGMTLRDYFAAAALQGMLSNPTPCRYDSLLADDAYVYADEMLKAREL